MAKAKTKPRKNRQRTKQGHLDGMEPPSIKEIDEAADNYFETMRERAQLSKDEDEQKTALIELMQKHDLARYEYDGKIVTMTSKSNVKVKRAKDESVAASLEAIG